MKIYTERIKSVMDFIYDFYKEKDIKTKDGLNSIFHVYEVASQLDTEEEIIVGLLHDYIEDGGTINDLVSSVDVTQDELFYILILSRNMNVGKSYRQYIEIVSQYYVATKVKIIDLKHNLTKERLSPKSLERYESLFERYEDALKFLEGCIQ